MRRLVLTGLATLCLAAPASARSVGITAAVNQEARGTPPGQSIRTLAIGENVIFNERIETSSVGLLQILLADGTAFTVGPNSTMSIDRFVYDPDAGTAEVSATLTKGVFRFIGGKTSKTPGGAKLDSPVGTIGIRGAVVDVVIDGRSNGRVSMVFGEEVTLTAPGGIAERIYEPGYSIVVQPGAGGSPSQSVQRTPPGQASVIQQALTGAPGTNGGAARSPDDVVVARSEIGRQNSVLSPTIAAPPIPQSRPAGPNDVQTAVQNSGSDLVRDETIEIVDGRPPPEAEELPFGLLTAGSVYQSLDGRNIVDPGAVGLVGGSDETDLAVGLTPNAGATSASGAAPRGALTLPLYADTAFTTHVLSAASGATLGGVPLTGTVYSGADGFAAYALAIGGDRTDPLYALRGTPTDNIEVLRDGDVRTYSFSEDMLQGIDVPFMRAGALGTDYSGASISPVYVVEELPGSGSSSRLFESWLLIKGQGAAQVSGIGVNVGDLFEDGGVYQSSFGRRGSYRSDSLGISIGYTGGIATTGGGQGGNHVFGANGQNFVLSNDFGINDDFGDATSNRSLASERFGTLHVLNLQAETQIAQFASAQGDTRTGSRTINGFAAGLIEGVRTDGSYFLFPSLSGTDPNLVTVEFDADANSVGGEIEIGTAYTSTRVAFGEGIGDNTSNGDSAYITDDIFGARNNNSRDRTWIHDLDGDGNVVENFPIVDGDNPKTYFVSGDANPQPALLPAGGLCDCKFLEWGWWGTQIRARELPESGDDEGIRQGIHLATWVAGDVTRASDLSTLAGVTASYQGHAIGNVAAASVGGVAKYIAAGDMGMSWDFGTNSGQMVIGNFDGRNFAGTLDGTSVGGAAGLGGSLAEIGAAGSAASGGVQGAFVNDGPTIAKGVIGNFGLSTPGGDWSAVGIVAGARR